MNQPVKAAKKLDMRTDMPCTTEWVEERRAEWGKAHVNGCIRRALAGEAGQFYAIEGGHVIGTPFPPHHDVSELQQYAVMCGTTFAAFIAEPGAVHGTH